MYKGKDVAQLSMWDVAEYFESLRKYAQKDFENNEEARVDFEALKERLINYAFKQFYPEHKEVKDDESVYAYHYTLGDKIESIEIRELDYYDCETLDKINYATNPNTGKTTFWMYSKSPDEKKTFTSLISDILLEESDAASTISNLLAGRYRNWQRILDGRTEND